MRYKASLLILAILGVVPAVSLALTSSTSLCEKNGRRVEFETNSSSALNLDISPDGTTLVFDMLGDLYTVPVEGGRASQITNGPGRDIRPVWSADGRYIAFISDRDGGSGAPYVLQMYPDHKVRRVAPGAVSIVGVDGLKYLTHLEWMPGSQLIIVQNLNGYLVDVHSTGESAVSKIDNSGLERYYGNGTNLYRFSPSDRPKRVGWPAVGAGESMVRIMKYSKTQKAIEELPESISDAPSESESPAVTPDGHWIIYRDTREIAGNGETTSKTSRNFVNTIRLYDRLTRTDRAIVSSGISQGWVDDRNRKFPVTRRFAVSPDSRFVYVSFGGKIHRVELATAVDTVIPLTVEVDKCLAPLAHTRVDVGDGPLEVMNTRSATKSPDGRYIAFSALRKLFVMELPYGKPQVLIPNDDGQFYPAYSPDGKWIAFVSWSEVHGGYVWRVPAMGGLPERLTKRAGYYGPVEWSPDGTKLAFAGSTDIGTRRPGFHAYVYGGDIHILSIPDLTDRAIPVSARIGDAISFTPDSKRIVYRENDHLYELSLASIGIDGTSKREELPYGVKSDYSDAHAIVAPNGRDIAVVKKNNLWIYRCPVADVTHSPSCSSMRITSTGAHDPRWREDGGVLEWSYGRTYFSVRTEELIESMRSAGKGIAYAELSQGIEAVRINLSVPRARALSAIALKDARIITMNGDLIFDRGTVVIRDGRITNVGPSEMTEIPSDAKVLQLAGKTIMPGIIDSHAHTTNLSRGLLPRNHWELLANLAFGVTTIKDPSNGGHHSFQFGELTESGITVGPRIYGATGLISGIADVDSYQDAVGVAKSMKLLGGTFVKYHTGFSRRQRQWLFDAARSEGLNIAAHYPTDNETTQFNLTTFEDGATTAEHAITESVALFYDVETFIVKSGVGVSYADVPSLSGGYPSVYWKSIQSDPRAGAFLRFDPPQSGSEVDQHTFAGLAPLSASIEHVVKFLADLDHDGARVLVGSHGNYDGIGMHWSMWAHARGGMPNLHVLRSATLNVAWGLGLEDELGSIEAGKLADILILSKNPLDDIRNTLSIESVMKDGVLFDAMTLDELWPEPKPLPTWEYQTPTEKNH